MSGTITPAPAADHAELLPLDALVEGWHLGPWRAPVRLAGGEARFCPEFETSVSERRPAFAGTAS